MKTPLLRALVIGLLTSLVLSACAAGAPASGGAVLAPTQEAMAEPTEDAMMSESGDDMSMEDPHADDMATESPSWFDISLTDVNSGESFKLSDFEGQVVLVEGMAAWCTNCLRQQQELVRLHDQIGDAAISVAIDVDLNEDEDILRRHAERNDFDWRYAVATPELAQDLADTFGSKFLNPPSVPMFLVDKTGGVHLLDFGQKSVEYLTAQIQAYQ